MVVLGKPASDESAFAQESLEAFAREIEEETGTPVRIILNGFSGQHELNHSAGLAPNAQFGIVQ